MSQNSKDLCDNPVYGLRDLQSPCLMFPYGRSGLHSVPMNKDMDKTLPDIFLPSLCAL